MTQYFLGFSAGLLSLLAPCVLPLLPMVFSSSLKSSKWGPFAMAMGLALSFSLLGILTTTFAHIFDIDTIQKIGAVFLVLTGLLFLFSRLKERVILKLSFLGRLGGGLQNKIKPNGPGSEFLMGTILAMVWGPCSGPTLGLAFGIASQSDQMLHAFTIFLFFGLGAGFGLIGLGLILQRANSLKTFLMQNNSKINQGVGGLSVCIGILILSGNLGNVEEKIISFLPAWFVSLSSSL